MKLDIKAGTTSKQVTIFLEIISTGLGATSKGGNLSAYYRRDNEATGTSITVATAGATAGTWVAGGKIAETTNPAQKGEYTFDLPDAALATGAKSVFVLLYDSGSNDIRPCPVEIQLVTYDPYSTTTPLGLNYSGRVSGRSN